MIAIIGVIVVFALVFGGYAWAGGKMGVILHALPHELVVMGGASVGAFLIANDGSVGKATLKAFGKVFKGHKWHKEHYVELLTLMFSLLKLMRTSGIVAVESHIENPKESTIFQAYPHILPDQTAVNLICDTLRLMTMNFDNPYQMEDLFNKAITKIHHESSAPAGALQSVADGLPAIGIVAAVLGVIKTMASVDQPPVILGGMIASALVGTFMGVFIAYCFVGPFASKLTHVYHEETMFYYVIRDILISYLQGNAPQAAVEVGRTGIPSLVQPSFQEVEEAMQNAPKA